MCRRPKAKQSRRQQLQDGETEETDETLQCRKAEKIAK